MQRKRLIAEEAKKRQEQEDAKLAERLQADENRQDNNKIAPHLLYSVIFVWTVHIKSIITFSFIICKWLFKNIKKVV